MGFLDSLSTVLDRVGGAAQGFIMSGGNPAGAFTGAIAVEQRKKQEKAMERAEYMAIQNMGSPLDSFAGAPTSTASPGFFAPGGSFRTGVRDFGGFLSEFAPIAGVFGLGNRFQNVPPAGAQTINFTPPAETAQSGEILGANLGVGTALVQGARSFARSPTGQGLMDPNATAQILNNLGTYPRINFDANVVFFILTKRFRNDGPVVTKAAVRKTKTTLRRMKGVVDMYNSVCKPTTRRSPARRAAPKAVQLIKN